MKAAYILSYKYPDYIRTLFILQSLSRISNLDVLHVINTKKGYIRYFQTISKLIKIRVKENPEVYILGFRGTEIYWIVRLITRNKILIYDEFINPYLWVVEEHNKFKKNSFLEKLVKKYTKYTLKSADFILSDTKIHAQYSSEKFNVDINKFTVLYVGTDENVFNEKRDKKKNNDHIFRIFFYGNFLPLHGIDQIINAAKNLKKYKDIKFTVIGGVNRPNDMQEFINKINKYNLTNVEHKSWVDFDELPKYIDNADLCLGGPFGDTPQSRKVITGKTYQFLAQGKPVVIGKINEQVGFEDKINCLLLSQGTNEELTEKILWAYKNQSKLNLIGKKGRKLYEDTFSQEAQLNKLEEIFKSI